MVISVQWHLFQDYDRLRVCKLINVIRHVNRTKLKRKPHNPFSKDFKVFYQIQGLFALKNFVANFGKILFFCMLWDKFFPAVTSGEAWSWTAPRISFPSHFVTIQITPLWHYHKEFLPKGSYSVLWDNLIRPKGCEEQIFRAWMIICGTDSVWQGSRVF